MNLEANQAIIERLEKEMQEKSKWRGRGRKGRGHRALLWLLLKRPPPSSSSHALSPPSSHPLWGTLRWWYVWIVLSSRLLFPCRTCERMCEDLYVDGERGCARVFLCVSVLEKADLRDLCSTFTLLLIHPFALTVVARLDSMEGETKRV